MEKPNEIRIHIVSKVIAYEIVVHLAIVPDNQEQNRSFIDAKKKMNEHGGVCDNYSLEKRNEELIALEKHLFKYLPKSKLCSYNF